MQQGCTSDSQSEANGNEKPMKIELEVHDENMAVVEQVAKSKGMEVNEVLHVVMQLGITALHM